MSFQFPEKKFLFNWCKAFVLSPGILFPLGYLFIYLSTNIYLNGEFKTNLTRSVSELTGNSWQIRIKSINSSLILDTVTLNQIELTPTGAAEHHPMTISMLKTPCPELQKLLFSPAQRLSSSQAISKKMLADYPSLTQ